MSKRTILTLVTLVILSEPAWAQTSAGDEFRVNTYTTYSQLGDRRSVAAGPDGSFVVVWRSRYQDGSSDGVFGQRFDASGTPQGVEFRANTYTTDLQYGASVAFDGRGNFIVVWESLTQDGSGMGIFAQRYDVTGAARGQEFRVNTYTTYSQLMPDAAADLAGNFVIVWSGSYQHDGSDLGVFGQRYDASGAPHGSEFQINTYTSGRQYWPSVDMNGAGNFVVAWRSYGQDGSMDGVAARRFDASGVPQGADFVVNTSTIGTQTLPRVAIDGRGNFVVAWSGNGGVFGRRFDASGAPQGTEFLVSTTGNTPHVDSDANGNTSFTWDSGGSSYEVFGKRYSASGAPRGGVFRVNTYTHDTQVFSAIALDPVGNFVIAWASNYQDEGTWGEYAQRYGGLYPAAMDVDAAGNRVLEPGETVTVSPSWRNLNGASQAFAGAASSFTGPGAPTNPAYSIADAAADYGTVANAATASCASTGNCYSMATTLPTSRPLTHWDPAFQEDILPVAQGQSKSWTLHVGGSFTDVSTSSAFYRFIETILHKNVTGGCTATTYCPAGSTTRDAMAVFVLVSREPPGYTPPACGATPVFADVPASSPFCRWIEELVRRGVVGGCGGGNYCPASPATREQMAVFVLRTLDPTLNPPACGTPVFADVPASSPFCRWIEELARRGVVTGCGGGNYCPTADVTREQMAVFLTVTFGLLLYGP